MLWFGQKMEPIPSSNAQTSDTGHLLCVSVRCMTARGPEGRQRNPHVEYDEVNRSSAVEVRAGDQ